MILTSINRILLITIVCFSTLAMADHGVTKSDSPYQGNVLVGSADEAQLKKRALEQVLIKVSGNGQIAKLPEAKQLLNNTQQLISQYGENDVHGVSYFSAVFDKNKINNALKEMQQPVWGSTRPTTLVWLVNNDEIVSDNYIKQAYDGDITQALELQQLQRGINVQFPLMDLEDNIALSPSDIKGRFYEQLSDASTRYQRAHFVAADLQQLSAGRWKLSWQLLQLNASRSEVLLSDQFVDSKAAVTSKLIDALANYYASQYATLENQGDKFTQRVQVKGIISLRHLAQLHKIMTNMLAISSYNIVAAQSDTVTLEVKLKGGINSFKNSLSVEPHLQPQYNVINGVDSTSHTGDVLYFNWRK